MALKPRWQRTGDGPHVLPSADGVYIAVITSHPLIVSFTIRVRTRSDGWVYAYAATLASAKRKAARMIREEQR